MLNERTLMLLLPPLRSKEWDKKEWRIHSFHLRWLEMQTHKTTAHHSDNFRWNCCCCLYNLNSKWTQMNGDKTLNTFFPRRSKFGCRLFVCPTKWHNQHYTIQMIKIRNTMWLILCVYACVPFTAASADAAAATTKQSMCMNNLLLTCLFACLLACLPDHFTSKPTCEFAEWNYLKLFLFRSLSLSPHVLHTLKLWSHWQPCGMFLG